MTISKSRPPEGSYDENFDPRPKTVCIGVSLITVETETIIQDDRAVELPVEDDILYLTIPRELSNDWTSIALLAEGKGYFRSHWTIQSVWECVSDDIADEIF